MSFFRSIGNWFGNVGGAVKRGLHKVFDLDEGVVSKALNLPEVAKSVSAIGPSGSFSFGALANAVEKLPSTMSGVVEKGMPIATNALEKGIGFANRVPILKDLPAVKAAEEVAKSALELVKTGSESVQNPAATAREIAGM